MDPFFWLWERKLEISLSLSQLYMRWGQKYWISSFPIRTMLIIEMEKTRPRIKVKIGSGLQDFGV